MSVAKHLFALGFVAALVPALAAEAADKRQIVSTYGDIAQAMYQDALTGAEALKKTVGALVEQPGEATLKAARTAGSRPASPTSRRKCSASATPSSTAGKAR